MNVLIAFALMIIGIILIERFSHKRDNHLALGLPVDGQDIWWAAVCLLLSFAIFAISLLEKE
jgi:TRAP-type C4-dicarboxylate transport system permease small subunit